MENNILQAATYSIAFLNPRLKQGKITPCYTSCHFRTTYNNICIQSVAVVYNISSKIFQLPKLIKCKKRQLVRHTDVSGGRLEQLVSVD